MRNKTEKPPAAFGISGTVLWKLTDDMVLTFSPAYSEEGIFPDFTKSKDTPWVRYRRRIKKVVSTTGVKLGKHADYFLYECTNLKEIDLNNLDTSETKSLKGAFYSCIKLSDLNGIKEWDVSKVKSFEETFSYCTELSSIEGLKK